MIFTLNLRTLRPLRLCGRYSEFRLRLCRAVSFVVDTRHTKTKDPSLNLFRLRRFDAQLEKLDFLSALGWREIEFLIAQLRRYVPVPNQHGELRFSAHLLRAENELARQRLIPILDPDLPVEFPCAKRQMGGLH